jgi:hypothetical protein
LERTAIPVRPPRTDASTVTCLCGWFRSANETSAGLGRGPARPWPRGAVLHAPRKGGASAIYRYHTAGAIRRTCGATHGQRSTLLSSTNYLTNMLRPARQLENFELRARDGRIGHVTDFFFDDRRWTIRYFVVDTGSWLGHREVLVAPTAVHTPEWADRALPVDLTMDQVRGSPAIDAEGPVTREHELALIQYYNWPMYWGTPGFSDGLLYALPPFGLADELALRRPPVSHAPATLDEQHHIRSVNDVRGHHVVANDGQIGHVEDFLIDDTTWEIECLVIGTRNWIPGRYVLVAPDSIYEVGWEEAKVYVDLSRDAIRQSPAYELNASVADEYVDRLQSHHIPHRREEP